MGPTEREYIMGYQQKDIQERIAEITGEAKSISDALDQWELERTTMSELFDENQAYEIINLKLRAAISLAEKAIEQCEHEAQMWVTQRTRATIAKFRELVKSIESTITHSRSIKEQNRERNQIEAD